MSMDIYLARFVRRVAPRDTGPYGPASLIGPAAPGQRAVAISNVSAVHELDNDIFQLTPLANTPAVPGSVPRTLVEFRFWCTSANVGPCFVLFSNVNSVVANGLATSGNTMAWPIWPSGSNVAGAGAAWSDVFEIFPGTQNQPGDRYFSACSAPNSANVAGILYYRIISFMTEATVGGG